MRNAAKTHWLVPIIVTAGISLTVALTGLAWDSMRERVQGTESRITALENLHTSNAVVSAQLRAEFNSVRSELASLREWIRDALTGASGRP